jgi:hypothetical protein
MEQQKLWPMVHADKTKMQENGMPKDAYKISAKRKTWFTAEELYSMALVY